MDPAILSALETAMLPPRTILLVEPDASLRGLWRSALDAMGFAVRECSDGPAALHVALRSEIALLITELYLPAGRDRCLVRAVRREPGLRRIKILVVSVHDAEDDRTWALSAGADAYLVKPLRIGRFTQVAASLALSRQSSRAEFRASRYPPPAK